MSTVSNVTSTATISSTQAAAQSASAAAQKALLEAGQSLVSSSTGNTSIDPQTLVTALVNAKVAGQQAALQVEAANDNAQISAIGQLSAALAGLQGALSPLQSGSLMSTFTATASGSGITATAGSGAVASSYSVYVGQIAQAQSITSSAFTTSQTAGMGTGALTISLGSQSMTLNINSGNQSLSQIVSAINSATNNPGIAASIVTGSDGSHLVLSSTLTGKANTINVSVSGATSGSALAGLGAQTIQGGSGSGTYESGGISSTTTASGDGSALTIKVGTGSSATSYTVTPTAGETLSNIATNINTTSNGAVAASVVTDSTGQQHLVVTQPGGSSSAAVSVTSTGSDSMLTSAATAQSSSSSQSTGSAVGASYVLSLGTTTWTQTTAAQNAQLTVNGTPVTSALNTVANAVSGATLSLTSAAVGTSQTLTVAQDTTSMTTEISTFVSDYNTVISTISSLTKFNSSDPSSSGTLLGDSMINQITSSFGTIIGGRVTGSGVTATLSDLGISLNSDGTLSLNSTTLSNALQNNPSKVAAVFNSKNGIGEQLNAKVKTFTQTGGAIALRENALSTDLNSVTTQTNQLQTYITQLTSTYSAQFTALNDLMSTTNNETQYLTQLFGGANNTGTLNKSS